MSRIKCTACGQDIMSLPGNQHAYAGAKRRRDRLNPTPWPENTDTPAVRSDNLFICARRPTGSQPPRRSWLFGDAFPLSHRVAVYLDGIGIVHDTITDGVGQRWLADLGIPPGDGKL